jgi:hypothetical protein
MIFRFNRLSKLFCQWRCNRLWPITKILIRDFICLNESVSFKMGFKCFKVRFMSLFFNSFFIYNYINSSLIYVIFFNFCKFVSKLMYFICFQNLPSRLSNNIWTLNINKQNKLTIYWLKSYLVFWKISTLWFSKATSL